MMINTQKGFTLVEVLVALVVASIGLLGVATLSLQATRYNIDAKLRSQATMLAADMADRIRANPAAARVNYPAADAINGVNNNCDAAVPPCTAAQRAEQDVFEWNPLVAQMLPGGNSTIGAAPPVVGGTDIIITVQWSEIAGDYIVNESLAGGAGTVQRTITLTVRP